jgi:hypothetical protein
VFSSHTFRRLTCLLLSLAAGTSLMTACRRSSHTPTTEAMSEKIKPPAEITVEVFRTWRNARRGTHPAENQSNPYWSWLIQSGESSWSVNQLFAGPSSFDAGPVWSAERFGQSSTTLADGRVVLIAGEHEDYYDSDFFIYNDITIRHPDGRIEILGFPEKNFPPTDFHTASVIDGKIIVIGNLGYPEQRKAGKTQILIVDPATWEIRQQPSTGEGPGWIHDHQATIEGESIIVRRGSVWTDHKNPITENFDDWRLHLSDWRWERLTQRPVTVYELSRKDGEPNQLHDMAMWLFQNDHGLLPPLEIPGLEDENLLEELRDSTKGVPPKDRAAFEHRYHPDEVDHKLLPNTEESLETRIEVQGVLVRYDEDWDSVRLVIEGELPEELIRKLREDLKSKLEKASGLPYLIRQMKP